MTDYPFDIPAINNEFEVLANYLGIDTDVSEQRTKIQLFDVNNGINRFIFNSKIYVVASNSIKIPSDKVHSFNSSMFRITTKYFVKITGVRSPAGHKRGYLKYVGQYFEFDGNAYNGMFIKTEDGVIDLIHFNYSYINSPTAYRHIVKGAMQESEDAVQKQVVIKLDSDGKIDWAASNLGEDLKIVILEDDISDSANYELDGHKYVGVDGTAKIANLDVNKLL